MAGSNLQNDLDISKYVMYIVRLKMWNTYKVLELMICQNILFHYTSNIFSSFHDNASEESVPVHNDT